MRAHQIMTKSVVTVTPETNILEAADIMLRRHVSALPVLDPAGKLVGIVSEGDFIRRSEIGTQRKRGRWLKFILGPGQAATDFVHEHGRKVGDIMTRDPLTVTEDASLDEIAKIMASQGVKRLPVMRGERLVGIVTRSDFLPAVARLARNSPPSTSEDDRIRSEIVAEIGQAAWRPCKLKVTVSNGMVNLSGIVKGDNARRAAMIAAENVPGVRNVHEDFVDATEYPPPEEDLGGGDIVSLQEEPSTSDDEPL